MMTERQKEDLTEEIQLAIKKAIATIVLPDQDIFIHLAGGTFGCKKSHSTTIEVKFRER